MFNAGQQVGGAVGLAVIGSVAWTVVNRHVRDSLSHVAAGHNLAGPAAARPGSPIYDHALSSGVTTALTMGAGATVLALIITVIMLSVITFLAVAFLALSGREKGAMRKDGRCSLIDRPWDQRCGRGRASGTARS
jgi:hypothetical protein